MARKFCIFCGEEPTGKSKEHVLPSWLIEVTGNVRRTGMFGFDLTNTEGPLEPRNYAFSRFHFPACASCNQRFGTLEQATKPIVLRLLRKQSVSGTDLSVLLDWLDKVRLGLWLGFHQLDKNIENIEPRFHISQRIGRKDRLVVLAYSKHEEEHLSFIGPTGLTFRWLPSAFGLIINNLFVLNVSTEYLVARRLGFPHPRRAALSIGQGLPDYCELYPGLQRVFRPILKPAVQLLGAHYYQAMFPNEMTTPARALYENKYVADHSLDHPAGIGQVYCVKGDRFGWIGDDLHPWWLPDRELNRSTALKQLMLSVIGALKCLVDNPTLSFEFRDKEAQQTAQNTKEVSMKELAALSKAVRRMPTSKRSGPKRARNQ